VFLTFYTLELLLRFAADRLKSFYDNWFILDVVVVLLGILDISGLAGLLPGKNSVFVLRVVRLCKLVRIVRLFRFCKELYQLISSMTSALKTVAWMWALLALVIYIFAILFCNELGNQYPEDDKVQEWWGSVLKACFTLFSVLTLEGWVEIARHVWSSSPMMVIILIFFITLTTYAIVNVVVAVIVQHVVDESISQQENEYKRAEKMIRERVTMLQEFFAAADVDKMGTSPRRSSLMPSVFLT